MNSDSEPRNINRRSLLLGGASAALAATTLTGVTAASAATAPAGATPDGVARHPHGSPVTNTIGSAPISGYVYRSVCMYDFEPFDPNGKRTWGGQGVYSASVSTALRATVEIPPGALLRDVEYYMYNNSGSSVFADTYLYVPGNGTISTVSAGATIPSTGTLTAVRAILPATTTGPYPLGSKLLVSVNTGSTGTVQVNGARLGFSQGAGEVGLLGVSLRAYDSRTTSKFKANQTRTVKLPASVFTPGQAGVTVNVVALGATAGGTVKVWAADATEPAGSAVYFDKSGQATANSIVTGVSSTGQVKIKCSQATHVVLDVSATIA